MAGMKRVARTARTYPIEGERLARAVEEAVRKLPAWHLGPVNDDELQAVRRTRIGSTEVRVSLVELESGAHSNTLVKVESRRAFGLLLPGQVRRDLDRLLKALQETLKPET